MASGDALSSIHPQQFIPDGQVVPVTTFALTSNGLVKGLRFPPNRTTAGSASAAFRVGKLGAFSTGCYVDLLISEDPLNPMSNVPVVLGVTLGQLGASTSYYQPTTGALGTETTATVVMPTTTTANPGLTLAMTITVAVANMGQLVADSFGMIRVRRVSTSASDTGSGDLLVLAVSVRDH